MIQPNEINRLRQLLLMWVRYPMSKKEIDECVKLAEKWYRNKLKKQQYEKCG